MSGCGSRTLSESFNTSCASAPGTRRALLVGLLGELGEDAEVRPPLRVDYEYQITIGDNVWLGGGAVVPRDLPANVVAVGNPARVTREV